MGWPCLGFSGQLLAEGGLPSRCNCYSARLCLRLGLILFCFGVILPVSPLCLPCFCFRVLPFACLCPAPPSRALEVFVKLVAAATPQHPFVIVGQSCPGRFRVWSCFGYLCDFFFAAELVCRVLCPFSGFTLLPLPCRIDLPCLLYRDVAHFPWVGALSIRRFCMSSSRLFGLPDLSRALHVCAS